MRVQLISTALTLAATATLVACGVSAAPAATPVVSPVSLPSPAPSAGPTAAAATFSPKAAGFVSTVLVERKRNLVASVPSYIRVVAAADTEGDPIRAKISESEAFAVSYLAVTTRKDALGVALYESSDLPPLAAGNYTEGLRQIVVQPEGRSAAHKHSSGFEAVLVLEGTVMIRTALAAPQTLRKGQGFSIRPNTPIQLFNVGGTVARTLVYSINIEGLPFSTELDESP